MIFIKLYHLMPETVDFAIFTIESTILCYFLQKKANDAIEIRIHGPWIRFQHNNVQRPSGHGYSASCKFDR
jgi:hypothetical protein